MAKFQHSRAISFCPTTARQKNKTSTCLTVIVTNSDCRGAGDELNGVFTGVHREEGLESLVVLITGIGDNLDGKLPPSVGHAEGEVERATNIVLRICKAKDRVGSSLLTNRHN